MPISDNQPRIARDIEFTPDYSEEVLINLVTQSINGVTQIDGEEFISIADSIVVE